MLRISRSKALKQDFHPDNYRKYKAETAEFYSFPIKKWFGSAEN